MRSSIHGVIFEWPMLEVMKSDFIINIDDKVKKSAAILN